MTTVPVDDDVVLATSAQMVEEKIHEASRAEQDEFLESLIDKDAAISHATQSVYQMMEIETIEEFQARQEEFRAFMAVYLNGLTVGILFQQRKTALAALSD